MLALLLTVAAHAAPTTFVFVGQPACVELSYADGRTQLENTCPDALLIDQSVRLQGEGGSVVPPHSSTPIRDLSAFTLGMNGRLYRVVATLAAPSEPPRATSP